MRGSGRFEICFGSRFQPPHPMRFLSNETTRTLCIRKGAWKFPGLRQKPPPGQAGRIRTLDISFVGAGSCEGGGLNRIWAI
ncbi:hypothetical protein EAI89_16490 [Eubacterium sp. am_0171]|nr:hypothetical protein EAI89_16490 [Eubacterium sp. am_0171]